MKIPIQRLILYLFFSMLGVGCGSTITNPAPQLSKETTAKTAVAADSQFDLSVMVLQQLQQDLGFKPLVQPLVQPFADSSVPHTELKLSPELNSFFNKLTNQRPAAIKVTTAEQLAQYIENYLPAHDQVIRLRSMIQHYQSFITTDWPTLTVTTHRLGQRHVEIGNLRAMLVQLGDLPAGLDDNYRAAIFDPAIIGGLKQFQQRHGLVATGQLNQATIKELNVTPEQRIRQMQINLWRWFDLPAQLPERYLRVNIPQFQLQLYDAGELAFNMPVIVGRADWPTPRLTTTLTRITIHPTWTPPRSIIRADLLPRHNKQPGFLNRQGFELLQGSATNPIRLKIPDPSQQQLAPLLQRYRLVQAAGPRNALGKFRFSIVNTQAIFLHDTPAKYLFANDSRALSHGCIRLADANRLSQYLFKTDSRLNRIDMDPILRGSATRSFALAKPLPVFITYHTSWVDSAGRLQLRPDIYHLEQGS